MVVCLACKVIARLCCCIYALCAGRALQAVGLCSIHPCCGTVQHPPMHGAEQLCGKLVRTETCLGTHRSTCAPSRRTQGTIPAASSARTHDASTKTIEADRLVGTAAQQVSTRTLRPLMKADAAVMDTLVTATVAPPSTRIVPPVATRALPKACLAAIVFLAHCLHPYCASAGDMICIGVCARAGRASKGGRAPTPMKLSGRRQWSGLLPENGTQ